MQEFNIWGQPIGGKKRKKASSKKEPKRDIFGSTLGFEIKPPKETKNQFGIGLGWGQTTKKESVRDTRRSFSQTQKNEIWDRQNGKCVGSLCGHKKLLRSATHYDHIIPWEKGGKTVVRNGQALCPTCHTIKSQKYRLKKVDKKRKKKNNKNIFGRSLNPW